MNPLIDELQDFKKRLVDYLKLKVEQQDWHGVADAAMDIREIEAKLSVLTPIPFIIEELHNL
jgi:hypothetical protein